MQESIKFQDRFIHRPRLQEFTYAGAFAYHVVIVTRDRLPLLSGGLATRAVDELGRVAEATSFDVLAYVMMPDHMHALVNGTTDSSDLIRFVQRFKQRLGYEHKRATRAQLWQPSFFDHALRRAEAAEAIAQYIVENPVRAGLVQCVEEWPFFGGSLVAGRPRRS
jgi:REP element-mobilizing transposase RayT